MSTLIEFTCVHSLELTYCKPSKNLLILFNKERTVVCVYAVDTNEVLCSIKRNIKESIVYITDYGVIGMQLGEDGRAVIEKGIFCTNIELYHNYIKRVEIEQAMCLCLSEVELHDLGTLQPLLIDLTRRRRILNIDEKVLQSQQFKNFLELVEKLEKSQPIKPEEMKHNKPKSDGSLWANVVLNMIVTNQPAKINSKELASNLLKNRRRTRVAARWRIYLSWYKHIFLNYFPCMQTAPEEITKQVKGANRVLKRTINYILKNTPEEQVLAIGEERQLSDYRVFKWMIRKIISKRHGLDYTLILQNRMNEQILRIMSLPYIKIGMKLARRTKDVELSKEVSESYIRMKEAIHSYSL